MHPVVTRQILNIKCRTLLVSVENQSSTSIRKKMNDKWFIFKSLKLENVSDSEKDIEKKI